MNAVPKLRFKDDDGSDFPDWEEVALSEIAERSTEKNKDLELTLVLTNSAVQGVVVQTEYFDKSIANEANISGYYKVRKSDFVYNPRISSLAPVGPISQNMKGDGIMSPLYTVFRVGEPYQRFLNVYFKSSVWFDYMRSIANQGARHDRMNITTSDFMALPIDLPCSREREKIALFLSSVDKKIDLLRQKKNALELYKKGLMQKIFSQEIRFKGDDGSDFPEWEEVALGDVLRERKEYSEKNKGYPHISLTVEGVVPKSERYDRDFLVKDDDTKKYKVTRQGDICYNPANLKFGVIDVNRWGDGIFSPIYVTFEAKGASLDYVGYLVRHSSFINKVRKFEQGTVYERQAVHPEHFVQAIINLPCLLEQQKIASFLSAIDSKIQKTSAQIEQMETFKKGLLQQMFI
ncbi:restriction endonuclease subunit S [Paradonghicola geojensis]|nr:restriction endonuclease subunit S [Marivivens geojensis]